MQSLIRFFIERPLVVNLTMLLFLFTGAMALMSLQYNTYPDADTGLMLVETDYPGAGPEDVELSITAPLEKELLHIDGVDKVLSTSIEGKSTIQLVGNPSDSISKYDLVEKDVLNAIERALPALPNDLKGVPRVSRPEKSKNFPLMQIYLTGNVAEQALRERARKLRLEMRSIPGVAGISMEGYREREFRILLDDMKIRQLGISYSEVADAIRKRNVRESGGSLQSLAGEQDVMTIGKFSDPSEVADVVIFDTDYGNVIRVRDVARVIDDYQDPVVRSRVAGEKAIMLVPKGEELADKLGTARAIREYVDSANTELPADMRLYVVNDSSSMTLTMIDVLVGNALAGMVLVFLVLLCFFELRFTIWVVLGIPTSILMVFTFMPVLGITVNLLSMSALILMLGILVDDAVVIAESIFRQREYGHAPNEAALLGVEKVMLPVFASALTTVVTLAPMAFLGGVQGKIMWVIPVMAMLVLAMSLFECKFILPGHIAHSFRDGRNTRLSRPWFEWFENTYETLMMKVVPHRYVFTLGVVILFSLLAVFASRNLILVLSPDTDSDSVYIKVEAPVGTGFDAMEKRLLLLEEKARQLVPADVLEAIVVTAGHHDDNNRRATEGRDVSWGLVSVFLKPSAYRSITSMEIRDQLRDLLKDEGDYRRLSVLTQRVGADMGWPLEAVVIGNGPGRFAVADLISDYVATLSGVKDHWTSYVAGKPIVSLELDYVMLAHHDLSVAQVSEAVQIAFNGSLIDQFETIEENIGFRLLLDGVKVDDPESLYSLTVTNRHGNAIPLRSLVEFRQQPGEGTISHFLGDRSITVFADIDRSSISLEELNAGVVNFLAQSDIANKFPDVSVYFDGELVTSQEQLGSAAKAFLIALVCIAFILILLFHSALQPLMVIALIPLGVIGVFCVFVVHGLVMSMAGMIGIAGLMGVIVNDALVMLDRFNTERALHSEQRDTLLHDRQIVECASVRLRPIVITTVTTCAGLFPAAYGLSGSYDLITPMIMVMLWGVLLASVTTLFLLPCLYAMERDLMRLLKRDAVMQKLDDVIMYN